ncbi:MAG: amidase family protein, partial [Streptococcaceae bacterium]|nr:amidase family protein [Streptococcaceae bacterium]
MDIRKQTALEIGQRIKNKEISGPEVTKIYPDAIEKEDKDINSYVCVEVEAALKQAEEVQKKIDKGEFISPLAGVPIAVKDNVCIKGGTTTSASKMLENFKPPYTATVIEKLVDAGAVIIGKTNMDEFAMGGSTETSYFGITRNPWDLNRVPGGSSGGSSAAVSAELAPYSLASDTGGSIRQPSTFTNLTGIKPSFGSVSRYGVMAYSSSLDQVGVIGRNARDCAVSLSIISGPDIKDSTSIMKDQFDFCDLMKSKDTTKDMKGMRI